MHIENMKNMMECLCTKAKSEIDGNIDSVDTHELGEVIDMIKDLNEGLYYANISKSMEEGEKRDEESREMPEYYRGYHYDPSIHGDIYRDDYRTYKPRINANMRMYNDNRYDNGRYAPDGDGIRGYSVNYPDMYDPSNDFNNNKWRFEKPYESKFDKSLRYYNESKAEHDKGTEEDINARLKFLKGLLDSTGEVLLKSYEEASSQEQELIDKTMSVWMSKMHR